jgi:hypothetical protein
VWIWYSVIIGRTGGTSVTWWRRGVGSLPRSPAPHRRHWRGFTGTTASTSATGTSARACAAWPGWAPGRRPEAGGRGRSALSGSLDGGRDEFWELCPSRSVKAVICARNAVICPLLGDACFERGDPFLLVRDDGQQPLDDRDRFLQIARSHHERSLAHITRSIPSPVAFPHILCVGA